MHLDNPYSQRRLLRGTERLWSRLEAGFNWLLTSKYNPNYHLGTLSIFLLIVLTITGLYLTLFYRPGAAAAYASMVRIDNSFLGMLMRGVHRYASDALMLVLIIHAFKNLVSDRFWGSRWLAWVSGVAMTVLIWLIGSMGYFLIWDQRAQWLTEYLISLMGGAISLTFLGPDLITATFPFFVIVLFLHIFLPVALVILILVHIIRLNRSRVWSPRWLMVLSTIALVVLTLIKPATSAPEANLDRVIGSVAMDLWYLGFLPAADRLGDPVFWGLTILITGIVTVLPWAAKGKHQGPAVIIEPNCTGCSLCAVECPYRAIEMVPRHDETDFKSLAVVNPKMCTGCGLCVGACATSGVELTALPTELVIRQGLEKRLEQEKEAGHHPVVVFTCQRQATLGGVPAAYLSEKVGGPETAGAEGLAPAPVFAGSWASGNPASEEQMISCVLPCVGMVDADWFEEIMALGARDVMMKGCPLDDCNFREGPYWFTTRLNRQKSIITPELHWIESAPSNPGPLEERLETLNEEHGLPELPDTKGRGKTFPNLPIAGIALLLIAFLFALAIPADVVFSNPAASEGQVRLLLEHPGVVMSTLGGSGVELPEGSTGDISRILGGERHPVEVSLAVDGETVISETYEPRGLRSEGEINGLAAASLEPGVYVVEITINDDGEGGRAIFSESVAFEAGQVRTFIYDQSRDQFDLR